MWSWFDDAKEGDERRGRRKDADRRTRESFEERRRWDPDSDERTRPDNVDYDWASSDDDRRERLWDKSLKDAGFKGRRETEFLNDPDSRDDLPHRHSPRYHRRAWREDDDEENDTLGRRGDRLHIVCVDDTEDAMRAFRFAAIHLPHKDRLILTRGLYEGITGHDEADEQRMRRVREKFLSACADYDRKCVFRPFAYHSTHDFGKQVCNLADRLGARSVVVGKRAEVSDMRRSILGSASRSVESRCRVPVMVVARDKD